MGSGGGTGEATQLCRYNTEVILISFTKLGISKTSSRVGCEKTSAGCTQVPGDLSLGGNRAGKSRDCPCAWDVTGNTPCSVLEMHGHQAAALCI